MWVKRGFSDGGVRRNIEWQTKSYDDILTTRWHDGITTCTANIPSQNCILAPLHVLPPGSLCMCPSADASANLRAGADNVDNAVRRGAVLQHPYAPCNKVRRAAHVCYPCITARRNLQSTRAQSLGPGVPGETRHMLCLCVHQFPLTRPPPCRPLAVPPSTQVPRDVPLHTNMSRGCLLNIHADRC